MLRYKAIAAAVGGLSLFAGCSTVSAPEQRPAMPERAAKVEPVLAVRNSGGIDSEAMYRIGRYYQGQMRYEDAAGAYRKALLLDPVHVEAHNALGVVYALLGHAADAERAFKAAIALAPGRSHLHSNLGHHYRNLGRIDEARVALREAVRLDPANARAWSNLAGLESSVAIATVPEAAPAAAQEQAAAVPAAPGEPPAAAPVATAQLVGVAPGVWELRPREAVAPAARAPAPPSETPVAQQAAPVAALPALYKFEIANGNGVTGIARSVGAYLRTLGMQAPRLTNQKPFNQRNTVIQYVPGMEVPAHDLRSTLGTPAELVAIPRIERKAQIRLVLGRDFNEIDAVARIRRDIARPVLVARETVRR